MSSPITAQNESWSGMLGGLAVEARFDEATQTVAATVRNTLADRLCYVRVEPLIKSGERNGERTRA